MTQATRDRALHTAAVILSFLVPVASRAQTRTAPLFPRRRSELAFVANQFSNDVSAYRLQPNGALLPAPGSPFSAGDSPNSLAVVPSGRFLYVANVTPGGVTGFSVASDGSLSPLPGSPFSASTGTAFVTIDPSGRFLYAQNCGANCSGTGPGDIAAFTIDQPTGRLTPVAGSPFTTGQWPYSLAVDPTGQFAYVANAGSNNVYAYAIDSQTGALTQIGLPAAAGSRPLSIAVEPWNQFVFTANTESGNVSAFSIQFDGSLSAVPGSPFSAGRFTSGIAVSSGGKFVLVSAGPGVYVYAIENSGGLHLQPESPVAAGLGPNGIAIDPDDSFVYVPNAGSANVSAYLFNRGNGKLMPLEESPFPAGKFAAGIAAAAAPTHE